MSQPSISAKREWLWQLLGGPPTREAELLDQTRPATLAGASRLTFADMGHGEVPALLVPPEAAPPWPVVLHVHAHGNRYQIGKREIVDGRPALPGGPYATAWPSIGVAVLAIDLPLFGDRAGENEATVARAYHWRGDTLFGQMLRELHAVVGWLVADSRFRADRIGVFGLSMGATLAWWLAALDTRVAAVADLCCFADLGTLINRGAHGLHGPYMTVPGLVPEARTGQIAALAAPRPKLVRVGLDDPLTPKDAWDIALADLREGYADTPARLDAKARPGGHVETPEMRAEVLAFFRRWLVDYT